MGMFNQIPDRVIAARSMTIFPDDTFIVSYPRSGNTWTRFLVGNLLFPKEPSNFINIETHVPDIYRNSDAELCALSRPRYLKSHEYANSRYKKVIYIVRDPRDVAISYYYYHLKQRWLEDGFGLDRFVEHFIAGDLLYGIWDQHVMGWHQLRQGTDNFLFLRYETMLAQPEQEVRKIADFLGIHPTSYDIDQVVSLSSAESMRSREKEQSGVWRTTQQSRQDIPFVRGAKAGSWQSELSLNSTRRIEATWRETMETFGYAIVN